MKKILTVICCCCLTVLITFRAFGFTISQTASEPKLNDLANRLTILESSLGRFQIGGYYELDSTSTVFNNLNTFSAPDFEQQLELSLVANITQNLELTLKVFQPGAWGLKDQNVNPNCSPMTSPFQVDQSFFKFSYSNMVDYLGRFQFTLGPLGLMADFYANPVEGIALQKAFKNYYLIGVYSRVNTQYTPGTEQITSAEDYLAARIGWANQSTVIGLNLVPGLSGEKDLSIDFSHNTFDAKYAAEVGWYSFDSSLFPAYKISWVPGMLISYGKMITNNCYLQLKTGYFGPQFMPLYSSLAHSSGELREWFIPNSEGVEVYLQNGLKNGYELENRLIMLMPISNYNQPNVNYRWRTAVAKYFSAANQLQLGIDYKSFPDNVYKQLFLSWILQF